MEAEIRQDLPDMGAESWQVPLNWGPRGIDALAVACDAVIIVDVLSFSTSVDIALTAGATVFPCCDHEQARTLAVAVRGVAAVRRGEPGWSLSPPRLSGRSRRARAWSWPP